MLYLPGLWLQSCIDENSSVVSSVFVFILSFCQSQFFFKVGTFVDVMTILKSQIVLINCIHSFQER